MTQAQMLEAIKDAKSDAAAIDAEKVASKAAKAEASKARQKAQAPTIKKILALRQKGMGYTAIANKLNDTGVPTFSGGEKWYSVVVRGICVREMGEETAAITKARVTDKAPTTKLIVKLRKKGKGYPAIAAQLNADKVPTFSGGKKWHGVTVRGICVREFGGAQEALDVALAARVKSATKEVVAA